MGSAFDVVGERRQVDYSVGTKARTMSEEIEIKLRNHKARAGHSKISTVGSIGKSRKSHDYEKANSRTVHFPVNIAKDGEALVRYRVQDSW